MTGSDDIHKEGQAQQRKGKQEEKAAEARVTAEAHERKAESFERTERGHQGT